MIDENQYASPNIKGIIMKKQIILSSVFAVFTSSVCLMALPGVASADREKYSHEESSRNSNQARDYRQQQSERSRDGHYRRDNNPRSQYKSRNVKQPPSYARPEIQRERSKKESRYREVRRDRPDYKTNRGHTYYYQNPPRYHDNRRVNKHPYKVIINPPRHSHRGIVYLQPHRHYYPYRYRPLYLKNDNIWAWIAFTAITLKILDNLNDQQQREHERAIYGSINIPIGEAMTWSRGAASGSVTPVWEGRSNTGLYCREFRQEVTINDRTEVAHGTACRRDDGSWEIVD